MNVKTAIKRLNEMYIADVPFMHGRRTEIAMAIVALEKQIEADPINGSYCPKCGHRILQQSQLYCGYCGQRVKREI